MTYGGLSEVALVVEVQQENAINPVDSELPQVVAQLTLLSYRPVHIVGNTVVEMFLVAFLHLYNEDVAAFRFAFQVEDHVLVFLDFAIALVIEVLDALYLNILPVCLKQVIEEIYHKFCIPKYPLESEIRRQVDELLHSQFLVLG